MISIPPLVHLLTLKRFTLLVALVSHLLTGPLGGHFQTTVWQFRPPGAQNLGVEPVSQGAPSPWLLPLSAFARMFSCVLSPPNMAIWSCLDFRVFAFGFDYGDDVNSCFSHNRSSSLTKRVSLVTSRMV